MSRFAKLHQLVGFLVLLFLVCGPLSVDINGGSKTQATPTSYLRSKLIMLDATIITACTGSSTTDAATVKCLPTWTATRIGSGSSATPIELPSTTMVLLIPPRFLDYSAYQIDVTAVRPL